MLKICPSFLDIRLVLRSGELVFPAIYLAAALLQTELCERIISQAPLRQALEDSF